MKVKTQAALLLGAVTTALAIVQDANVKDLHRELQVKAAKTPAEPACIPLYPTTKAPSMSSKAGTRQLEEGESPERDLRVKSKTASPVSR